MVRVGESAPRGKRGVRVPVDARDGRVQGEGSVMVSVLAPDGVSRVFTLVRPLEGVVDARDDQEQPRHGGADSVRDERSSGVLVTARERIDWRA